MKQIFIFVFALLTCALNAQVISLTTTTGARGFNVDEIRLIRTAGDGSAIVSYGNPLTTNFVTQTPAQVIALSCNKLFSVTAVENVNGVSTAVPLVVNRVLIGSIQANLAGFAVITYKAPPAINIVTNQSYVTVAALADDCSGGGGGSLDSYVLDTVTQTAHGFRVMDAVLDTASTSTSKFIKGNTSNQNRLPSHLVVDSLSANQFVVQRAGYVKKIQTRFTARQVYYLRDNGSYASTPDSTYNFPVFAITSSTTPIYLTPIVAGSGGGGGGGGTPGGSNTQVQYNNAGTFSGITGATTNGTILTLTTPNLGTPSTLVGTNITGTAAGLTAGSVTTIPNLSGAVTSVGNTTSLGGFTSANLLSALSDETGSGSAVFGTSPTIVLPSIDRINNGYTTTTTAASTTILTSASNYLQFFTGTSTQIVQLPVTSTLVLGTQFYIRNNSTGAVTVQSSGGNAIVILAGNTRCIVTCISTSGTAAASWSAMYLGLSVTSGKALAVSSSLTLSGTDGSSINAGAGGSIAYQDAANAFTLNQTNSFASIASTPAERFTGTWHTGSGSTNTKPHIFIEPSTVTTSNSWSNSGTGFGMNAPTGFAGNLIDCQLNGGARFSVTSGGIVTASNTIQTSGNLISAGGGNISWSAKSIMTSPSNGIILFQNQLGTDFTRTQYGGTTNLFPAHKRVGATIEDRLADDSGFAATQSLYDRFGTGTPEGNVTAPIGAVYHRTDGGTGTSFYVKESGTGSTGWVAK